MAEDALQTSFRPGASVRTPDAQRSFAAALDLPLSVTSTWDVAAKNEFIRSYGAGTALRDFTVPEGRPPEPILPDEGGAAPETPSDDLFSMDTLKSVVEYVGKGSNPAVRAYDQARQIAQYFINDPNSPTLTVEEYKKSKYFRDGVDPNNMTEDRAAALAMSFDAQKIREYYMEKRPIASFVGGFLGQAADPINYIPIAGPAVRAAAIAKLGKVGGTAAFSAVDAAANTALFGLATRGQRAKYGDDVSWQMMAMDVSMAALIGGAFGTIGGALGARKDAKSRLSIEQQLSTLKRQTKSLINLNESIDALAKDVDLALSPNAADAIARTAADVRSARPLSEVGVTMRERLVASGRNEVEAAASARIIDDAYTTFADRAGMTVKELSDVIGLPVIRSAGEATGSGRLYQGGAREIKTLYHYTGAPEGTRLEPRTPAVPDGASPQAKAVYFATSAEDAYSYRRRAAESGKPRMEQVPVDTTGFKNITAEIKKIRRRAGVESFGQAKAIAQQEAIAAGAPGTVFDGDGLNAGEVAVFDASRLYAEQNRTLFQSAAAIQGAPIDVVGTGPGGRVLNKDLGKAFTDRHMAEYGRPLDPDDPADYEIIRKSLREDYAEQKAQPDNGEAWYSDDIASAVEITKGIIPDLDVPENRDLFLTITALLSPQQKPSMNWENAVLAMQGYLRDGTIPTVKPNGKQFGVDSHTTGLQLLQHLITTKGLKEALLWVRTPISGREMAEVRRDSGLFTPKDKLGGYLPNETNLNETKLGIYMMGPKVGDFMQNSVGIDQNAVTVDLWMARTYNRLIGRLTDVPPGVAETGGLADQVRGRAERDTIKRLVRDAAKDAGIDPSSMQAALWYFEQRLYRNHGIRSDSQNFSGAAKAAAAKRGIAERGADSGRSGGGAGAAAGNVQEGVFRGRGGSIPVNAAGRLEIRHFSHRQLDEIDPAARGTGPLKGVERGRLGPRPAEGEPADPNVVDRAYFGTGKPPTEADMAALTADRRAAEKLPTTGKDADGNRVYPRSEAEQAAFRKHVQQRGYAPEGGLGDYEHIADVDPATIYNVLEDPLGIRQKLDTELAKPEQDTQFERLVKDAGFKGLYYSESKLGQTVLMFEKVKPTTVRSRRYGMPLSEIATPDDFKNLTPETFQKGGWGIVTATQEKLGPANSAENVAANEKLRKELKRSGLKFQEVGGAYQGVDQGVSFLVFAPEARVAEFGKKYKQESILTRKGLEYGDGRLVPANPADTVVGEAAAAREFVSTLEDGTPFSVGLDFDKMTTPQTFNQAGARGSIEFSDNGQSVITLFEKADASTVVHESGHYFLNMLRTLAEREGAPSTLKDDWQQVRVWWESNADAIAADIDGVTPEDVRAYIAYGSTGRRDVDADIDRGLHEQWARAFESYLREGIAPTENLKGVFQQFKDWLVRIYTHAKDLNVNMTPEIRGVFDRMLGSDGRTVDTTPPRPEPVPEGRVEAEANLPKTEDYKALAAQHRVDPDTGAFDEEPDIAQLEVEGRLTAEDAAVLADSKNAYDDGAAYGEALKAAVGCLI